MSLQCLALYINHSYCVIFDLFSFMISFNFCFLVNVGFLFSEKLFTLVSNMQISRFNLIIYNFCNWSASSTLIYRYAIISPRDLTCRSVFRVYSCRALTCCPCGALDGFTLGTYDATEIGYLEILDLLFVWRYVWIHTRYILWYRARIFRWIDWRNCRSQLWGFVARWFTCISFWTCNCF